MPLGVNDRSEELDEIAQDWPVLDALMGGTRAMRKAKALMPQWPGEPADSYKARLETATLFPAYHRTVGVMAGKPFSKAITLEDADASIEQWSENIDQQGTNLHTFCADLFRHTVAYGMAGILVEYSRVSTVPRSVAELERSGVRPYWVAIRHDQVLGWKMGTYQGAPALSQLRLLEIVKEDDGQWGTTEVAQVRVLYQGGWQIYRQMGSDRSWQLYDEGVTSLARIPFVPTYGRKLGQMLGQAPMIDLAYLNVKHWQSQSDQDNILHVARVPVLCRIGVDVDRDGTRPAISVGANTCVDLPIGGDLRYVEHTGAAIEAGRQSLQDLEEQMIQTGAELLVKKSGQRTATESANDAEANKSDLQRIAEGFEDSIDMALEYTAEYRGLSRPGSVELFSDYGADTLTDASANLVKAMGDAGYLTRKRVLNEMKRRGIIAPEVDPDAELAAAEVEGPALGEMGMTNGANGE